MSEKFSAEEIKFHYEAAHLEALARKEQALAKKAELDYKAKKREAKQEAALNTRNHVLNFEQTVRSTKDQRDLLDKWHRLNPDADWTINMNSPGGSVIDGMALYDHLTAHSLRGGGTHKITIVVRGYAASMGGILLQAADERICGPESYILIHKISTMTGGSLDEIEDEVKLLKLMTERVEDIFFTRSNGKLTKSNLRRNWNRKDWWLDSKTAHRLGVVDTIG